jgi:hypothetical protein
MRRASSLLTNSFASGADCSKQSTNVFGNTGIAPFNKLRSMFNESNDVKFAIDG